MNDKEHPISTLIFPTDYAKQLNSLAGLTSENFIFLKRKLLSQSGWELVKYPLSECSSVEYKVDFPLIKIFFGALLLALVVFIFVMLGIYWNDLEPGTRLPVGLVGLGGLYGARVAFGGRRHNITVKLQDGTSLKWSSKSGELTLMSPAVSRFTEFCQSKGLMATDTRAQ
jgi:hypothetical protein